MTIKVKTKTFDRYVRDLEKGVFPEFEKEDIYCPPNNQHMYFAPSWHFRSGLLTREIVDDLKVNHRALLSVGSGSAYLERFLVKVCGVRSEQIVLSDMDPVMPNDFEQHRFNMYGSWPNFGREFNYVVFPESVLINCIFHDDINKQSGLYHLLEQALRMSKPNARISMNGHCQSEENIEAVKERLYSKHFNLKLKYDRNLIVVESGELR